MKVVFIGTESSIMDTPYSFNRFGQRAELPDSLAERVMAVGPNGHRDMALLTEDEYASTGLTDAEVKANYYLFAQNRSTSDHVEKRKAALALLHNPVSGATVPAAPEQAENSEHDQ